MQRIAHKPKSGLTEQITESLPGAVTKVSTKLSFEVKPLQQWVCIQFAPPIGVQKKSCWMPLQGWRVHGKKRRFKSFWVTRLLPTHYPAPGFRIKGTWYLIVFVGNALVAARRVANPMQCGPATLPSNSNNNNNNSSQRDSDSNNNNNNNKQQTTNNEQRTTNNKQQTPNSKQQEQEQEQQQQPQEEQDSHKIVLTSTMTPNIAIATRMARTKATAAATTKPRSHANAD